ncbi:hypothetical protein QBC35DRAFT_538006 [Podospora australis]|uniref:Uncharacterized protein n=1 Tax=Podospora australis TaxID=1536484 RepID=A0AAN6WPS5_9PEZI|nr:hypothetical protein QBC35DRAFT_538006 [Podospora australis]
MKYTTTTIIAALALTSNAAALPSQPKTKPIGKINPLQVEGVPAVALTQHKMSLQPGDPALHRRTKPGGGSGGGSSSVGKLAAGVGSGLLTGGILMGAEKLLTSPNPPPPAAPPPPPALHRRVKLDDTWSPSNSDVLLAGRPRLQGPALHRRAKPPGGSSAGKLLALSSPAAPPPPQPPAPAATPPPPPAPTIKARDPVKPPKPAGGGGSGSGSGVGKFAGEVGTGLLGGGLLMGANRLLGGGGGPAPPPPPAVRKREPKYDDDNSPQHPEIQEDTPDITDTDNNYNTGRQRRDTTDDPRLSPGDAEVLQEIYRRILGRDVFIIPG